MTKLTAKALDNAIITNNPTPKPASPNREVFFVKSVQSYEAQSTK